MKIVIRCAIMFAASVFLLSAAGTEMTIEALDLKGFARLLRDGWTIESVKFVDAPRDWVKLHGGRGIQIVIQDREKPLPLPSITNTYFATYQFTVLPLDWNGSNKMDGSFKDGKYDREKFVNEQGGNPDVFKKTYGTFYFFEDERPQCRVPGLEKWLEDINWDIPNR